MAMNRIPCRTIAFDDAFVKQFGPDEAEFIPDLKLAETPDAIYSISSVFVEIPEPDQHHSQSVEVRLPKRIGDKQISYTLRLRKRGIVVECGDEFPVISAVGGLL